MAPSDPTPPHPSPLKRSEHWRDCQLHFLLHSGGRGILRARQRWGSPSRSRLGRFGAARPPGGPLLAAMRAPAGWLCAAAPPRPCKPWPAPSLVPARPPALCPELNPLEPFSGHGCLPPNPAHPPACPADVPSMVLAGFPQAPNWLIMLVRWQQGTESTLLGQIGSDLPGLHRHRLPLNGRRAPLAHRSSPARPPSLYAFCLCLQANVCILVHMLAAFQVTPLGCQRVAVQWNAPRRPPAIRTPPAMLSPQLNRT